MKEDKEEIGLEGGRELEFGSGERAVIRVEKKKAVSGKDNS